VRVLYFSKDYSPHDHRFLSAVVNGGHQAYYLRLEPNSRETEDRPVPSQVEQVHWAGGHSRFHWRDVPRVSLSLRRVIRKIRPDLIHAGPIQTCTLVAALSGFRPLLCMSWGFDLMQDVHRSRWMEWATRYALKHSTYFTSDASVTRDEAIRYGMRPDRTCVIPWGVDLQHFRPREPGRDSESQSPPVLFCNRSWEPRYGVDVLARAFVQVAQRDETVSLILLGGGSQAQAIRKILHDGSVHDRVVFGGRVSQTELPGWYHMADLYISPSHVDGTSVSLMEALACGLPAIVSDIPGNQEWVREDVNGWLFPDGDAEALAGKVLSALKQRRKFSEIGKAARNSVESRANWTKNAALLMQVYEETYRLG